MYSLLSRIPDGLNPLRDRFEKHVRKAGLSAIEKVAGESEPIVKYQRGGKLIISVSMNMTLIVFFSVKLLIGTQNVC